MRIAKIRWLDSFGVTPSWECLEDAEKVIPVEILSVGIVMVDSDEYIEIALSKSEECIVGRMAIPKGCITDIKYIEFNEAENEN